MKAMVSLIKRVLRPFREIVRGGVGFIYDYSRFLRYAGYRRFSNESIREYRVQKIYHGLEKSLSFRNRKTSSGWAVAQRLMNFMMSNGFSHGSAGHHERIALKVLDDFERAATNVNPQERKKLRSFLDENNSLTADVGGALDFSFQDLRKGILNSPEDFFLSRYSIRDFSDAPVSEDSILRALRLAMKAPSACNRQAWHVYHTDKRELIDQILKHQSGNRGFGHEVPCLLVVTADLNAYDNSLERYQHWIDGGMFAMQLVMALHSLGLGVCCLNWSKGMKDDLRLRRTIEIKDQHTLIMMLAVGYPNDELKVCHSSRAHESSIYTYLN